MAGPEALHIALSVLSDPLRIRQVHQSALPQGVTTLLEIAIGKPESLAYGQAETGLEGKALQEAANFFIEQILLDYQSDSYRTLGCGRAASHEKLRRHMALLMRWLHPDLIGMQDHMIADRQIFVTRVSRAWEDLKSPARRQAYDRSNPPHRYSQKTEVIKPRRHPLPRLNVFASSVPGWEPEKVTFWQRLMRLLERT